MLYNVRNIFQLVYRIMVGQKVYKADLYRCIENFPLFKFLKARIEAKQKREEERRYQKTCKYLDAKFNLKTI